MSDLGVRTDSGVRELARFWPVVLVCALIGAAFVGLTAYLSAPAFEWRGEASLRVTNPTGLGGHPSPATAVAVAAQPDLRATAIRRSGADEGRVGSVSAAVDPKDPTVVRIAVLASTAEVGEAVAGELRGLVASATLDQIAPRLNIYAADLDASLKAAREAAALAQEMQTRLEADPQNVDLQNLLLAAEGQQQQAEAAARGATYQLEQLRQGVADLGGVSAVRLETKRSTFLGLLQGALAGAVVGIVIVAAVVSSRASRSRRQQDREPHATS